MVKSFFTHHKCYRTWITAWLVIVFNVVWYAGANDDVFDNLFPGREFMPRALCESGSCKSRADLILASVNQSADPCQDFYAYVCNRWDEAHPISDDLSSMNPFVELRHRVQSELADILENLPVVNEARTAREKAAVAFRSCMDTKAMEEHRMNAVKRVFQKNGLADWPVLPGGAGADIKSFGDMIKKTGLKSLFSLNIVRDNDDLKSRIIEIAPISDRQLQFFAAASQSSSVTLAHKFKEMVVFAAKKVKPDAKEEALKIYAGETSKFLAELDKKRQSSNQRLKSLWNYQKTTVEDFQKSIPGFDLLDALSHEFGKVGIQITKDEKIVVSALPAVKATLKLYLDTKPEVVYNYIGFMKTLEFLPLASERFHTVLSELSGMVTGAKSQAPRWRTCTERLQDIMKDTTGRLYTEKKLSKEPKDEAENYIREVGRSLYERLRHVIWMDRDTREKARNKLWEMTPRVGYPDKFLSDEYIDEKYKGVGHIDDNEIFVEIVQKFQEHAYHQMLSMLRKPIDDNDEWSEPAAEDVNAYYTAETNEIYLPGGILQGLFFQEGLPSYINLGAIGSIIGHEMSHGYDDQGRFYDERGRLVDWWGGDTEEEFNDKKECFIEQYGKIVDPDTNKSINGENTVGENIADNGGVRLAFATYRRLQDEAVTYTLPGLDDFLPQQLFFISYALMWCGKTRPELNDEIMSDVHSPNRWRVNVPLRNMDEFTAAFECRTGTPMHSHRKTRCVLW